MRKILTIFLCFYLITSTSFAVVDELAESLNKNLKIKPYIQPKISENSQIIKVKIKESFSSKNQFDEGDEIIFLTLDEINLKGKIYKKDTPIKAQIELISQNKSLGVPANVVIGNFTLDEFKFFGEISKKGANRALWVQPLVQTGSLFFGAGLVFIPIRGGHVKINPKEEFELELYETQ